MTASTSRAASEEPSTGPRASSLRSRTVPRSCPPASTTVRPRRSLARIVAAPWDVPDDVVTHPALGALGRQRVGVGRQHDAAPDLGDARERDDGGLVVPVRVASHELLHPPPEPAPAGPLQQRPRPGHEGTHAEDAVALVELEVVDLAAVQ